METLDGKSCLGSWEEGSSVESGRGWYALYTRHQHEKKIANALRLKGFSVFLPLYSTARRWKDRTKLITLPLFPSYVFIETGFERQLDILTTAGIHGFVCFGSSPALIPPSEIDSIRKVMDRSVKIEPHPFIKHGDWVRIKSGPLTGIEGILVRKRNWSRLVLSVELLGKSVAVDVDASIIERINTPDSAYSSSGACGEEYAINFHTT